MSTRCVPNVFLLFEDNETVRTFRYHKESLSVIGVVMGNTAGIISFVVTGCDAVLMTQSTSSFLRAILLCTLKRQTSNSSVNATRGISFRPDFRL